MSNDDWISLNNIIKHMEEALNIANSLCPTYTVTEADIGKVIKIPTLRRLVRRILSQLGYEVKLFGKNKYLVIPDESFLSINFLLYVLRVNPYLPLSIFCDDLSKTEARKFIRNNVYCALLKEVPRDVIFDELDARYQRLYDAFNKSVVKRKGFYEVNYEGQRYVLPVNRFGVEVFIHEHGLKYLPKSTKNDIAGRDVLDLGAYIGDSTLVLNKYGPRKIYAVEPMAENVTLLKKTITINKVDNVTIIDKAISDKRETVKMLYRDLGSSVDDAGRFVEAITIDDLVFDNNIDVALIKMDIEGMELPAIKGAYKTIKEFKPTLIVSLYHRGQDFFEIPKLVKNLVPEYKMRFMNCHRSSPITEKMLIAWVH